MAAKETMSALRKWAVILTKSKYEGMMTMVFCLETAERRSVGTV